MANGVGNGVNSSCSTLAEFADKLASGEINAKERTIRQQIIEIYPRLREIMQDKNLTRAELYRQFKENFKQIDADGNEIVITEKTFFNYLAAGKLGMDKEAKKQARKDREANKIAEAERAEIEKVEAERLAAEKKENARIERERRKAEYEANRTSKTEDSNSDNNDNDVVNFDD